MGAVRSIVHDVVVDVATAPRARRSRDTYSRRRGRPHREVVDAPYP
jgi:hypothetical protein